jgi:hypothetical protein
MYTCPVLQKAFAGIPLSYMSATEKNTRSEAGTHITGKETEYIKEN